MASNVKKMILRYGKCLEYDARGRNTKASVRCDGCGKVIKSDEDLSDIQFLKHMWKGEGRSLLKR